jgi:hypothetical protein
VAPYSVQDRGHREMQVAVPGTPTSQFSEPQ